MSTAFVSPGRRIFVAGGTGYLGGYVIEALLRRGCHVRALTRDATRLLRAHPGVQEPFAAEVTDPRALQGCCAGMDAVISTLGITRQRDGLRYMDLDYRGNLNLLEEARRAGVKRFLYVSVFHAGRMRRLKLVQAKERFAEALRASGLEYRILRPVGFFSDMEAFLDMARRGRVWLPGNGRCRMNPVDGADLAEACLRLLGGEEREAAAGGPQVLSHDAIARLAFGVLGRPPRMTHIPAWLCRALLGALRLGPERIYGPLEFFLAVMSMDMIAPPCGERSLEAFFRSRLPPE